MQGALQLWVFRTVGYGGRFGSISGYGKAELGIIIGSNTRKSSGTQRTRFISRCSHN